MGRKLIRGTTQIDKYPLSRYGTLDKHRYPVPITENSRSRLLNVNKFSADNFEGNFNR